MGAYPTDLIHSKKPGDDGDATVPWFFAQLHLLSAILYSLRHQFPNDLITQQFVGVVKILAELIFCGRVCFISKQDTQIITTAIQDAIHVYVMLAYTVKDQIIS